MVHVLNQRTGEITPITDNSHQITPDEILILTNESPEAITHLQNKWQQDYPGDSHALTALRNNLVFAECHRNRVRSVFQQLQLELHFTGLPMHHWDRLTLRHYSDLDKLQSRAQRDFLKALQLLHDFSKSHDTRNVAKAKQEAAAPKVFVPNTHTIEWAQYVTVEVIDGKVITKVAKDAAYWLREPTLHLAQGYCRHFYFPDAVIPEPYKYVLEDEGEPYEPARYFFISYAPDEFMRLCQLEVDTNSEHLLDGERTYFARLE
jgi:hypothetical protein